jgi:hypothetical protein
VGRCGILVSEPQRDHGDVDPGLEHMHGGGMFERNAETDGVRA